MSILTSALELVVLTDCPPGPDDLIKVLEISWVGITTSLYDSNLELANQCRIKGAWQIPLNLPRENILNWGNKCILYYKYKEINWN